MPPEDPVLPRPQAPHGFHIGLLLCHEGGTSRLPGHSRRVYDDQGQDHVPDIRPQNGHQHDRQQGGRNGLQAVAEPHQDIIQIFVHGRVQSQHQPQCPRYGAHGDANQHGNPRTVKDPGKHVSPHAVRSEPVLSVGSAQPDFHIQFQRIILGQNGSKYCHQQNGADKEQAHNRRLVSRKFSQF